MSKWRFKNGGEWREVGSRVGGVGSWAPESSVLSKTPSFLLMLRKATKTQGFC